LDLITFNPNSFLGSLLSGLIEFHLYPIRYSVDSYVLNPCVTFVLKVHWPASLALQIYGFDPCFNCVPLSSHSTDDVAHSIRFIDGASRQP